MSRSTFERYLHGAPNLPGLPADAQAELARLAVESGPGRVRDDAVAVLLAGVDRTLRAAAQPPSRGNPDLADDLHATFVAAAVDAVLSRRYDPQRGALTTYLAAGPLTAAAGGTLSDAGVAAADPRDRAWLQAERRVVDRLTQQQQRTPTGGEIRTGMRERTAGQTSADLVRRGDARRAAHGVAAPTVHLTGSSEELDGDGVWDRTEHLDTVWLRSLARLAGPDGTPAGMRAARLQAPHYQWAHLQATPFTEVASDGPDRTFRRMIGFLQGHVLADGTVLTAGGVGYRVRTVGPLTPGATVELTTIMVVREHRVDLYGFTEAADAATFDALLGVSGVSGTTALNLLAGCGRSRIAGAVADGDPRPLTDAVGVGPKLAGRIVAELPADRLGPAAAGEAGGEADRDLIDALTALGYAQADVAVAVADTDPSLDPSDRLAAAMRTLAS